MIRHTHSPRKNWQQIVEEDGLVFHSPNGQKYWDESVSYQFSMEQVLKIEEATNTVYALAMQAVQHVIDNKLYSLFHIPENFIPYIENAWNNDAPSLYGRFDFAWDGTGDPKMLEYNADTPTSLLEASIIQWKWMEDIHNTDQLNSIHERLIEQWHYVQEWFDGDLLHFACVAEHDENGTLVAFEDRMTTAYLQETAEEAGIDTKFLYMHEIGWNESAGEFRDLEEIPIDNMFKLYPWEWMINEEFGTHIMRDDANWFEPPWKMILSNKAILPILWKLFPGHPNLLPAYFEEDKHLLDKQSYVKKPLFSREGANVEIVIDGTSVTKTEGEYGEEGYVYQKYCALPNFENNHPVLGLWIVGDECAGMGIREDNSLVTGNFSRFVPHFIK